MKKLLLLFCTAILFSCNDDDNRSNVITIQSTIEIGDSAWNPSAGFYNLIPFEDHNGINFRVTNSGSDTALPDGSYLDINISYPLTAQNATGEYQYQAGNLTDNRYVANLKFQDTEYTITGGSLHVTENGNDQFDIYLENAVGIRNSDGESLTFSASASGKFSELQ